MSGMNKESLIVQLKELAALNEIHLEDDVLGTAIELAHFKVFSKNSVIKSVGEKALTVGIVLDGLIRGYYIDGDGTF